MDEFLNQLTIHLTKVIECRILFLMSQQHLLVGAFTVKLSTPCLSSDNQRPRRLMRLPTNSDAAL